MRSTGESTTTLFLQRHPRSGTLVRNACRGLASAELGSLPEPKRQKHPLTRSPARRDDDGFVVEREAKHFFKCTGIGDAELDYSWAEMLRCADTNKDGRISREEFNAYIMADAEVMRDGTFKDKLIERNLVNERCFSRLVCPSR